jgi:hypothetical protein
LTLFHYIIKFICLWLQHLLEAVSKPQIRFKGKAQADEKAEHILIYVSILKRAATLPLGLRWGFETASSVVSQK